MKNRCQTLSGLLLICLMAGVGFSAGASIVQTSQSSGSSDTAFDSAIKTNLIQNGQGSLGTVTADNSAINGTFSAAGLNDGVGLAAGNIHATYYEVLPVNGTELPNSDVFQLTAGYNITNIQVISGWTDHNLGKQAFQLFLSLGGGPFVNYGTFTNSTSSGTGASAQGSYLTTLTDSSGTIATNVTGIQFIFTNPDTGNGVSAVGASQAGNGSDGGTVIHEVQVFGTYYTNLVATNSTNNSGLVVIPVTDTNVLGGLTLNDWVCGSNFISASVEGAALTVGFQGTGQVALRVNNSQLAGVVAARYPILAWSVNGGAYQSHQLAATDTAVVLAAGVTNPVIDLYIKGMSPFEDRYTGAVPPNSVDITGFLVASNATTTAVAIPRKVWLNIGDSIMSGDEALYAANQGRPPDDDWAAADDARASYGYLLARHYGYAETRIAYGGYDWAGGLGNVPALVTLIDQKTSTASRLSNGFLNPMPDVVLINLGENGAPALADVTNALFKLRSRVKPATKILVMVPVAGTARAQVTQAFNSYKNSAGDTNAYLVDLGQISYPTGDGQHPIALGHEMIYQDALPFFDPIIQPAIIQQTQYGLSANAFDGFIATNLVQAGQNSLGSVTVSEGTSHATTFANAGLNDGSAAADTNLTYYGNNDPTGGNLPVTFTFTLNTNIASGYNITSVQAITGWTDSDLADQNFQLLFSLNGGPFTSYGVYLNTTNTDALNGGNNSILVTLTNSSSGPIAAGVTGVQFIFQNPIAVQEGAGGTLIRELQVFGTPVVRLGFAVTGENLVFTWPQGVLQEAASIAGPWTDDSSAVSPFTTSASGAQKYYRVRVP